MENKIHKQKIELLSKLIKNDAITKEEALLLLKNEDEDSNELNDFIEDLVKKESIYPNNGTTIFPYNNSITTASPQIFNKTSSVGSYNGIEWEILDQYFTMK